MWASPCLKRQDSLPVSMMWARCVKRSTTALAEPWIGQDLRPFAEGEVGGDDRARAFVALGDDLEDELGGALGQSEVAQFVAAEQLDAGVACDDAVELAP